MKSGDRKSVLKYCESCKFVAGVKQRYKNVSYIRTSEANKKSLLTKKKRYGASYGEKQKE